MNKRNRKVVSVMFLALVLCDISFYPIPLTFTPMDIGASPLPVGRGNFSFNKPVLSEIEGLRTSFTNYTK